MGLNDIPPQSPQPAFLEEDIRPSELMSAKEECVRWDREFLLSGRDEWLEVVCPACGSDKQASFGTKNGFTYVECPGCATVYTSPRPSLNLMHRFYAQSKNYAFWNEKIFPASETTRRRSIFAPRANLLAEHCRKAGISGGTFLEIGAAFGTFCEEVRSLNLFERIIALEPTPGLAETCRKRGFETLETPVEDLEDADFADVLSAFEVIEHLYSPADFILKCKAILKPKGLLVLSCPNVHGFDMLTLGTSAGSFDHEHVNYFHPDSLRHLLERMGLEVLEQSTPGRMDAELVRKQVLDGRCDLSTQPFLRKVLIENWDTLGKPFQDFLAANRLSSHQWIVARKPGN